MKIKYIPGMRPVPMLMYYTDPNQDFYNDLCNSQELFVKYGFFSEHTNHLWNMSAYIIYDENLNVSSLVSNQIGHFVWLLRTLNKPLIFELNEQQINEIKQEWQNDFSSEFEIIS